MWVNHSYILNQTHSLALKDVFVDVFVRRRSCGRVTSPTVLLFACAVIGSYSLFALCVRSMRASGSMYYKMTCYYYISFNNSVSVADSSESEELTLMCVCYVTGCNLVSSKAEQLTWGYEV